MFLKRMVFGRYSLQCTANSSFIMPKRFSDGGPVRKRLKIRHINSRSESVNKKNKIPSIAEFHSKHNLNSHVDVMQGSRFGIANDKMDELSMKVEYLENPIKSDNDKKDYRVIKLSNGLVALLISDTHAKANCDSNGHPSIKTASATSGSEDEDSEDEDSEGDSDESADESDDQGGCSDSDDDVRVAKSSKKEEKMAACGLCVGVGSFSDPPEIPGLAHFLEHMLFMGSKKYPTENDFDAFIKKSGGSDNAHTDCEHTTFYFEVDEKYFFPALDRFAQFFIAPLLLRDSVSREREAVESEFQMALPSDMYRKEQLFGSLARSQHPATKFTWGNLKTLRDDVADEKLYEQLHEFRQRHYSAHRMTLSIQARLSLDELEEHVKKCFSGVPNNELPAEDFSKFAGTTSFDTKNFRRIYKIKPTKDICQIELTWAMPSMHHLYKSKPHQYVSWIIGHEGKGSLVTYLRKKMWCLDIFSGNGESGFEHNSMYALFSLTLILTDEGHAHLKEVFDAIFSYINMVRKLGPQKRIYDEIRMIEEINFKFVDDEAPFENVENLSESMQLYAPSDYITGSELYFEYDPKSIKACMNALIPDNVNIIIFDKKFDDSTFEKVEPWFGTKYTDEAIPIDWINDWQVIEPLSEFFLPEPNVFVTDDFSLVPVEPVEHPEKIHNDNLSEIWFKPDSKFRLPECHMNLYFMSPVTTASPEGIAMIEMMAGILKLLLVEELYPAVAAQLGYEIRSYDNGLMLKIGGLNQKLPLLLEKICNYIAKCSELITEDLFNLIKTEQLKTYYNKMLKPKKFCTDARFTTLLVPHWSVVDRHAACNTITLESFCYFTKNYLKHVYIKCLVQGNMTKNQVLTNILSSIEILKCEPLLPNTFPRMRVLSLPSGAQYLRIKNFNASDTNSVVTNYYQSNLASIELGALLDLLMMIMEEPLFNQLRTKEQLGYDVSCMLHHTFGVLGYSVIVCTQASKFSMEHIDNRIEEFLKSFSEILDQMSDKELESVKESLIKVKLCADNHLKEEADKNWSELVSGEYQFDRISQEVEEIRKIGLEALKTWFKNNSVGGSNFRKLSIQVVGIDTSTSAKKIEDTEQKDRNGLINGSYTFQYLQNLPSDQETKSSEQFITNIGGFREGLYAYPIHPKTLLMSNKPSA